MLTKNDNASDYFMHHNKEKYWLGNKRQNIKKNKKNLVDKSSDHKNVKNILLKHTPQNRLFANELSFSLKEVWLSKQEFLASIPISNLKYNYLESQNNNTFYPLNDQLNYALAHYFAGLKITKDNVDKFLFDLLIAPLTKKLFY